MEIRLSELNDKSEISYIEDYYVYNEKSLSVSNGLTSTRYEEWFEKIHDNYTINLINQFYEISML